MAAMTFESKLKEDGSFLIPNEAVETLGLHPGDEIKVRIETSNGIPLTDHFDQRELHRRARLLFKEADQLIREPAKPFTDPLEAAWAEGVEEKARRMGIKL